jgi:hypothetical protein
MKNFLQVLLVGTILVSAGDGYSQIIPGYTSPETERYLSGGFSSSAGASNAAAAYSDTVTDAAQEMLKNNPVSVSLTEGIKYNNNVLLDTIITLTALENDGYKFDKWVTGVESGEEKQLYSNARTITVIANDTIIPPELNRTLHLVAEYSKK